MKYTLLFLIPFFAACHTNPLYDTIIRNGLIYDGNGGPPIKGDIAINADTIAAIGDLTNTTSKTTIEANGKAISPGFINMLSWATESLIEDGRSQSDIR
ncbi:MAG: D-aminoacylase, partial [Saprospiraceae bacterium]